MEVSSRESPEENPTREESAGRLEAIYPSETIGGNLVPDLGNEISRIWKREKGYWRWKEDRVVISG